MRTRSQAKRPRSVGKMEAIEGLHVSDNIDDNETLPNISRDAVGKLLKRVKKGFDKEDIGYLRHCESAAKMEGGSTDIEKNPVGPTGGNDTADPESYSRDATEYAFSPAKDDDVDDDDCEWENGSIPTLSSMKDFQEDSVDGVSVEFDVSNCLTKRKPAKRATAEEKDVAEFVHKAHLLCLLGRGRLVDSACDDPLIQASLLSLLPTSLLKIADSPTLTASNLSPLVSWFHNNFHVRSPIAAETPCHLALASTLETREGSPEAVAALSVALFRALNLTTRFVSILDVASLKPDADKSESVTEVGSKRLKDVFGSSTLMVAGPSCSSERTEKSSPDKSRKRLFESRDSLTTDEPKLEMSETPTETSEPLPVKSEELKRKGDVEFQMQLEMAMSATAIESCKISTASESPSTSSNLTPLSKRLKKSNGISTAIGSKKVGAPLYWAEVFCSGENLTGKWVHVDAVNAIVDGEHKVEAAAAACKKSLRYVVAFAGNGAKDVTRRYCTKWYKVASSRINSIWWDAVLAPLKELESGANGARSSLEDIELQTRALTEPLPTNQQAYRNHHLYVIERWVKKYQILYPKGPVLGFCSGHAVYPRTCVQTLHTKQGWLREGLQVKDAEVPAKVLKRSQKCSKEEDADDDDNGEEDHQGNTVLYGKWQTEPLVLPRAVNGIVPKNERGRVDVWSEKCLPPGTVHLRLPRVVHVARRLGIDFAHAFVGFEFKNGQSFPVFEGIVVCTEFKDAVLQAYLEEEERRESEEKRKNEAQALSKWYQLLSSIITRQRLNNAYGDGESFSESDK
ncbi:hypothetical protein ABFS82_08G217000 [Erythranthe guttata]|nr:PREDICTED: DNA repair protein complementing XP-C cells homolog [Erythranthe guttata]|eukprot:XP_012845126.1 PREDICTED: DNA repair protein complementing XP-C cells homolog [Erythranthe guttata]